MLIPYFSKKKKELVQNPFSIFKSLANVLELKNTSFLETRNKVQVNI